MITWYIIFFILTMFILYRIAYISMEKKMWNNGRCPKCGHKWRYYMTGTTNERYYTCDKCGSNMSVKSNIDNFYNKDE